MRGRPEGGGAVHDPVDLRTERLRVRRPALSAHFTFTLPQLAILVGGLVALVAGIIAFPLDTLQALVAAGTFLYAAIVVYQLLLFRTVLKDPPLVHVSDHEARAIPDADLPLYTVLVPIFREAEIVPEMIGRLQAIEYPRSKLEVLFLLEEGDAATLEAVRTGVAATTFGATVVPRVGPQTKPKACNYGLAHTEGELVTIYDAEDAPEPLQLRRAVAAFRARPAVSCLQARLGFHNVSQNLLTRLFACEYIEWFAGMLPALASLQVPIPLGGTSMHIRRSDLEAADGWDSYNVTEDADLGVRLHRLGFRTAVLDSETLEEANSDLVNWVRQRSRWYKGYLQTWLVHMRHPRRLWDDLGPAGLLSVNLTLGGTPLLHLVNPFFWMQFWLWFLIHSQTVQFLYASSWVYYIGMSSMIIGNTASVFRTMVVVRSAGRPGLVMWVLLVPFYWIAMSIAAVRGVGQLVVAPWYWDKTEHGLGPEAEGVPAHD